MVLEERVGKDAKEGKVVLRVAHQDKLVLVQAVLEQVVREQVVLLVEQGVEVWHQGVVVLEER